MKYDNKSETYYNNIRPEMQELFPDVATTLLDVGCGKGGMAKQLKARFGLEAWGIEFMEAEAKEAALHLDRVLHGTVEESIAKLPDGHFDVIYFNDVLEHLVDPYQVLEQIKPKLTPKGRVISSIPNMRYHRVFKEYVFKGNWKYTREGVMDFTHLRFFTSHSIRDMYEKAGYTIETHKGVHKTSSLMPYIYNVFLLFRGMDLFYMQFATVAKKRND